MINAKSPKIKILNSILIEASKTLASSIDNNKSGSNISNKEDNILKALEYN
jgi:hypothetical protein